MPERVWPSRSILGLVARYSAFVWRPGRGGPRPFPLLACYVVPAVAAAASVAFDLRFPTSAAVAAGIAVFGGFMFSLLLTILQSAFDMHKDAVVVGLNEAGRHKRESLLALEVIVSYAVAVSVVTVFWLAAGEVTVDYGQAQIESIASFLQDYVYFAGATFLVFHTFGLLLTILQELRAAVTGLLISSGLQVPEDLRSEGDGQDRFSGSTLSPTPELKPDGAEVAQ